MLTIPSDLDLMEHLKDHELSELKEKLREEFSDYYEMAGGKNYRYNHLVRVHGYVKRLMETDEVSQLEFDPRVVEVAALFHDIGRKEDIEEGYLDPIEAHEGHAETGAELVEEYVQDYLTQEQLEKVERVIRNHHDSMETVEGKIVKDADNLGLFGVMNLWRMFHYSADNKRELEEAIDYFWGKALKQRTERLDRLHFDVSKQIARKRMTKLQEAMVEIEDEHRGTDIE